MKTTFTKSVIALIAFGALLAASAKADPLTLNSPGVVGIWNILSNDNANDATRLASAQHLLDLSANTGTFPTDEWVTSSTEYSAVLTGPGVKHDGLTAFQSISGYDWAFAKYDGPNAGYVLFYLGGAVASTIVPQYPANLWTTKSGKYGVSGVTFYNETPTQVPDSGTTAILLGAGLIFIGLIRRKSV
jgi:hypothetical protein